MSNIGPNLYIQPAMLSTLIHELAQSKIVEQHRVTVLTPPGPAVRRGLYSDTRRPIIGQRTNNSSGWHLVQLNILFGDQKALRYALRYHMQERTDRRMQVAMCHYGISTRLLKITPIRYATLQLELLLPMACYLFLSPWLHQEIWYSQRGTDPRPSKQ